MIDVGQPLRAWFTFWHPNTHSMLTEVTFCISCYLLVLSLEYIPILLRNRQLRRIPSLLVFEHQLHKVVPVLAAVGTLLSFFHQGSLGGLYGVLRGRPFAFRSGVLIWPSTFFLFILSAIASGPSFLLLITAIVEKVTGRKLVGGGSIPPTGIYLWRPACYLCCSEVRRHVDMAELHLASSWIRALAVLPAQAVWDAHPLRRDCAFRVGSRPPAHLPQDRIQPRVASDRRRDGLHRRATESLRIDRANSGSSNSAL